MVALQTIFHYLVNERFVPQTFLDDSGERYGVKLRHLRPSACPVYYSLQVWPPGIILAGNTLQKSPGVFLGIPEDYSTADMLTSFEIESIKAVYESVLFHFARGLMLLFEPV